MGKEFYFKRHPVQANILVIILVAIIGFFIVYLSLNIFTRHGQTSTVPEVENMSFTNAVKILHDNGFRTDIRDSIFNEEITPGFVIEQFPKPGSKVKPGRKVFLYINAVHPRELIIEANNGEEGGALRGYSLRQGLARLEELGFKKVNVIRVPGEGDRIIRLKVNGKTVEKNQKVPVTALVTVEVNDGGLNRFADSLLDEEYLEFVTEVEDEEGEGYEEKPRYDEERATPQAPEDKEEEGAEEPIFIL